LEEKGYVKKGSGIKTKEIGHKMGRMIVSHSEKRAKKFVAPDFRIFLKKCGSQEKHQKK